MDLDGFRIYQHTYPTSWKVVPICLGCLGTPIIPIIPSAESYRIHLMFGPGIHGLGGHSRYWKLKGMGFAHVRGYLGSSWSLGMTEGWGTNLLNIKKFEPFLFYWDSPLYDPDNGKSFLQTSISRRFSSETIGMIQCHTGRRFWLPIRPSMTDRIYRIPMDPNGSQESVKTSKMAASISSYKCCFTKKQESDREISLESSLRCVWVSLVLFGSYHVLPMLKVGDCSTVRYYFKNNGTTAKILVRSSIYYTFPWYIPIIYDLYIYTCINMSRYIPMICPLPSGTLT